MEFTDINNDDMWDTPQEEHDPQFNYESENNYEFNPEDDSIADEEGFSKNEPDQSEKTEKQTDAPNDYLSRLLRLKQVDRSKVRIENENGEIEEIPFDDLDDDTKFGILSNEEDIPFTDEEVDTLNFLRDQNMNLAEFVEYQKQEAIKEYLEQNQEKNYTVDNLSDDDLYRFDLLDQMPDLTEEEVEEQLERAKENENFFNKRIAALRNEYRQLQEDEEKQQQQEIIEARENQFNQLAQNYINVARNLDEINGMELEDEDKEEILSFMLDRDANGQTQFYKLFSNPEIAFKLAWYALKGEEAHNAVVDYFTNELARARKNAKSYEAPKPKIIKKQHKNSNESDIYGLDSF